MARVPPDARHAFRYPAPTNTMTTTPTEELPSSVVAFRDAQWKTRWLVVGLAVLLLWRSTSFVDREWLSRFPFWLVVVVTGLAPQAFLFLFPILTRNPHRWQTFGIPAATRCLVDFCIAIPGVIGMLVVLTAVDYLVGRLSPGTSLTPDAVTGMAVSPDRMYTCLVLVFSFTFAPIAEELFFRGFLHNAFRARMPVVVAGLAQSLVFGFGHFFGVTHGIVAFAMGLLLTVLYEWRKTLIAPILVHAGMNFVAALGTVLMMVAHANSPVMGVVGGPNDTECVVRQVVPGSAAEEAGLQVGDIITAFNGEPIRDFRHLGETIRLYRPGDVVPVTINRSGSVFEVAVVLRRRGSP
jgi:membrane protease YdiL (CAAX protease family)